MFTPVKTPCVGICSTGIGDAVCRGCKRFSHEVIDWNAYSEDQRRIIESRLAGFMSQVVGRFVAVEDEQALRAQLEHQRVRYRKDREPLCWVYDLLRAGSRSIREPAHYGLRMLTPAPLPQVKSDIDADYYALSVAYYEAYIVPGMAADGKADPTLHGC